MANVSRPEKTSSNPGSSDFKAGTTIRSDEVNADISTLYATVMGSIDNENISNTADIAYTKLDLTDGGGIMDKDVNPNADISGTKLFNGSIPSSKYGVGSVDTTAIGDDQVTMAKASAGTTDAAPVFNVARDLALQSFVPATSTSTIFLSAANGWVDFPGTTLSGITVVGADDATVRLQCFLNPYIDSAVQADIWFAMHFASLTAGQEFRTGIIGLYHNAVNPIPPGGTEKQLLPYNITTFQTGVKNANDWELKVQIYAQVTSTTIVRNIPFASAGYNEAPPDTTTKAGSVGDGLQYSGWSSCMTLAAGEI